MAENGRVVLRNRYSFLEDALETALGTLLCLASGPESLHFVVSNFLEFLSRRGYRIVYIIADIQREDI